MKKAFAAVVVMLAVALGSLAFALPAQAYPDTPPNNTTIVKNNSVSPESITAPSSLPNTGGPDEVLLVGALGLVLVGGVAVAGSRRRASE